MTVRQQTGEAVLLRRRPRQSALGHVLRFVRRKPLGAVALLFIVAFVLVALFADVITTADAATRPDSTMIGSDPGAVSRTGRTYLLGGDELGRDLFARVVYGARVSLTVSIVAVGVGGFVGTLLGLSSAYLLGWWDLVGQRVMDAQQAIPGLLMAMLLVSVLQPSLAVVTIALGLNLIPGVNRVARGATLAVSRGEFVEAARSIGCRPWRVMLRHLLPNIAAPIIVIATTGLGAVIIGEASLSFLGFGIPAPTPTWGGMISGGGRTLMFSHPLVLVAPATALALTVLSFNLFGDALRDVLDPRLRL
ncbi:MAG TPA: ABC transporter permease [Candidatus Limnocylindria bacterium]